MSLSCLRTVTRGCQGQGRPKVKPVIFRPCTNLPIVDGWQLSCLAASLGLRLPKVIPTDHSLSLFDKHDILFTKMPGFKRKLLMFFRMARARTCEMQKEWWNSEFIWGTRSKKMVLACCTCKSKPWTRARQIQCYWHFCSLTKSGHPKH